MTTYNSAQVRLIDEKIVRSANGFVNYGESVARYPYYDSSFMVPPCMKCACPGPCHSLDCKDYDQDHEQKRVRDMYKTIRHPGKLAQEQLFKEYVARAQVGLYQESELPAKSWLGWQLIRLGYWICMRIWLPR
jgi:hypothetical protein